MVPFLYISTSQYVVCDTCVLSTICENIVSFLCCSDKHKEDCLSHFSQCRITIMRDSKKVHFFKKKNKMICSMYYS